MKKILKSFQKFMKSSLQNIDQSDDLFQQYHWYYTFTTLLIAEQFFKYLRSKYK